MLVGFNGLQLMTISGLVSGVRRVKLRVLLNFPEVAVMATSPAATPLKLPLESIVATKGFDDAHTAAGVAAFEPALLTICEFSWTQVRALMVWFSSNPVMASASSVGGVTIISRVDVTLDEKSFTVMVAMPGIFVSSKPFDDELKSATVGDDDVQVNIDRGLPLAIGDEMSALEPSEK